MGAGKLWEGDENEATSNGLYSKAYIFAFLANHSTDGRHGQQDGPVEPMGRKMDTDRCLGDMSVGQEGNE